MALSLVASYIALLRDSEAESGSVSPPEDRRATRVARRSSGAGRGNFRFYEAKVNTLSAAIFGDIKCFVVRATQSGGSFKYSL